ncbi:MAG: AI-2E family transporter [Lachnospiraceae bacterium]|nr:AI-2E family transporter [Lachnospiraceae bacterium]
MDKKQRFKNYIYWGVTAFCVIAASIAFGYALLQFERVKAGALFLVTILTPVIYGAVLAYLLAPIYNRSRNWTERWMESWVSSEKRRRGAGKCVGTLVSLVLLFTVVAGLISMLIPELIKSVQNVIEAFPDNINNFALWLENMLNDNPDARELAVSYMDQGIEWAKNWAREILVPNMNKIISGLSSGMFSVINWVKNILIGLIVTVYLLNIKEGLATIAKKCIYGIFPVGMANRVIREARFIHEVFGGFIIGKLLDSLIIGIICFIGMSAMKMPYVLLISVIIGVTNIIPFFGPFIGAIPATVLVLLVNPIQSLYFLGFILLLQQFDGNILGPKILGESTGVSSFWVLFSILFFGGLFGFVGMIIGVPTFAVIYRMLSDAVKASLRKKHLPVETSEYEGNCYVDETSLEIRRPESGVEEEPAGQEQSENKQEE